MTRQILATLFLHSHSKPICEYYDKSSWDLSQTKTGGTHVSTGCVLIVLVLDFRCGEEVTRFELIFKAIE